ncbi:CLUMA_CG014946, isoform A [Clunio marinus]|uniref:CLUMA_CG014946, isoform A n=1 Tax=Clunio marinus TaxID=568069 RepID=A0A1J1IPT3_9DIPT|nr:CLUMA_CG014946, isoform A [Clunio marinus]
MNGHLLTVKPSNYQVLSYSVEFEFPKLRYRPEHFNIKAYQVQSSTVINLKFKVYANLTT